MVGSRARMTLIKPRETYALMNCRHIQTGAPSLVSPRAKPIRATAGLCTRLSVPIIPCGFSRHNQDRRAHRRKTMLAISDLVRGYGHTSGGATRLVLPPPTAALVDGSISLHTIPRLPLLFVLRYV